MVRITFGLVARGSRLADGDNFDFERVMNVADEEGRKSIEQKPEGQLGEKASDADGSKKME